MRKKNETLFYAIALAMGIASVVLSLLGAVNTQMVGIFSGIGVFCLALMQLNKRKK